MQSKLCPAGKHAVGLGNALGNQVIHQYAQVRLITAGQPCPAQIIARSSHGAALKCGIDASEQTLCRSLFIACGAVNLPRKKQAANLSCFKTALQGAWVKVVILNGITGPKDVGIFQPLHRPDQGILNVKWQTGGNAIWIKLVGGQTLGLQEDLVAVFVGKSIDLVFYARAITRPNAFNFPHEHGASVKARSNDLVGSFVGVSNPTRHLRWVHVCAAHEAENRHARFSVQATRHAITRLFLAFGKVNGAAV